MVVRFEGTHDIKETQFVDEETGKSGFNKDTYPWKKGTDTCIKNGIDRKSPASSSLLGDP